MNTDTATYLEDVGRELLAIEGRLAYIRELFTLSRNALATLLDTNTNVIKRWESGDATRVHDATARRLGVFYTEITDILAALDADDIDPRDLQPLAVVAVRMGLSPHSALLAQKCRTGVIACRQLGVLGIYIPVEEAEALVRKKV